MIYVGAPVAERGWILQRWIDNVRAQDTHHPVKIVCVYTESSDDTFKILEDNGVDILYDRFLKSRDRTRIDNHWWGEPGEYRYMANLRNNLVRFVQEQDAQYFFSWDTDILLPHEDSMQTLLDTMEEEQADAISPLVNMAEPHGEGKWEMPKDIPPCWNFMYWGASGQTGIRTEVSTTSPFPVDVLMAAILMNRRAMSCRWREHSQGEDLGWSWDAQVQGVNKYLHPGILGRHVMASDKELA